MTNLTGEAGDGYIVKSLTFELTFNVIRDLQTKFGNIFGEFILVSNIVLGFGIGIEVCQITGAGRNVLSHQTAGRVRKYPCGVRVKNSDIETNNRLVAERGRRGQRAGDATPADISEASKETKRHNATDSSRTAARQLWGSGAGRFFF